MIFEKNVTRKEKRCMDLASVYKTIKHSIKNTGIGETVSLGKHKNNFVSADPGGEKKFTRSAAFPQMICFLFSQINKDPQKS